MWNIVSMESSENQVQKGLKGKKDAFVLTSSHECTREIQVFQVNLRGEGEIEIVKASTKSNPDSVGGVESKKLG